MPDPIPLDAFVADLYRELAGKGLLVALDVADLETKAAAVRQALTARPRLARVLAWAHLGAGPRPDLAPVADTGPELVALVGMLERLAARPLGSPTLPASPTREGFTIQRRPVACPGCGYPIWRATPVQPEPGVPGRWISADATDHTCQV